jgi:hypothetical protein
MSCLPLHEKLSGEKDLPGKSSAGDFERIRLKQKNIAIAR